jgi:hypothetical protein
MKPAATRAARGRRLDPPEMKEDSMTRGVRRASAAAALALAGAAAASMVVRASAGPAPEDDLAVVKRAVAQSTVAPAAPARPAEERPRAERPLRASGKEPTWLKVRVTDKTTGRKKVTVNLPMALVRAVGDGWPRIDFDCGEHRHARCAVKVSEILAALEAGQDLVEIDEDDQTVRVWLE